MFELKRFSNRLALKIIQLVDRHTTKLTSDKELHFNDQTQVRPIDPATETRLRWKITGEGHLIVAGDSDGGFKAKVEFRAFPQATRQQNLFHFLLDRYPADVSLADCFQAAYQEEYDNGALNEDPARYLKSLRALFSDLDKKLVKEGFPKGLLPKVSVDRGIAFPVRIIAREVLESSSFSGD